MYNSILSRDKLNNINLFKKDNDINQYIQELDKSFENKENIGDKKESSSIEPDYGESEFFQCNFRNNNNKFFDKNIKNEDNNWDLRGFFINKKPYEE